jgi:hypothetical protein
MHTADRVMQENGLIINSWTFVDNTQQPSSLEPTTLPPMVRSMYGFAASSDGVALSMMREWDAPSMEFANGVATASDFLPHENFASP